jgi:glutamine amidotransferase
MRVTVFDYGAGNLHSILRALAVDGVAVAIENDPARLTATDLLVLPGVGAFGPAAARLAPARARLRSALRDGLPCLGVCLGMQLLFETSDEGIGDGIGLFAGAVTALATRRRPHMGWNRIAPVTTRDDLPTPPEWGYFAHGYACRPADPRIVTAWCVHERERFPAIVGAARTVGVQFHPEKSGDAGRAFVRALVAEVRACA